MVVVGAVVLGVGLVVGAGLSSKVVLMRWKKGATDGGEGLFLLAAWARTVEVMGAEVLGSGTRRSRRDCICLCVGLDLRSADEDDDGMLSVLLGLVGFGDGRWSEDRSRPAMMLRDRVVLSLLAHGSSRTGLSTEGRMINDRGGCVCSGCSVTGEGLVA